MKVICISGLSDRPLSISQQAGALRARPIVLLNTRLNDPLQGCLSLPLGVHENVHFPLLIG